MLRKGCSILFILTIVGAIIGAVLANYWDSDKRVEWEYIGVAPENQVDFVNTYRAILLEGSSGNYYANCGLDCWEIINIDEYTEYEVYDLKCNDREPPDLPDVILEESFCEPWGPGRIHTIFSITEDNSIYKWRRRFGEWDVFGLIIPPIAGAIIFFLVGIVIILLMRFNNYLESIRQNAIDKGTA